MSSLLEQYVIEPPPRPRSGPAYVSEGGIKAMFRNQRGRVTPICLSRSYLILDRAWIHQALKRYHDFLLAITGKPPQEIYTKGLFVCPEFANSFDTYLDLCHVLYWKESIGPHKLAAGWGANWEAAGNDWIPDGHAFNIFLFRKEREEGYELCGIEPQFESVHAQYGRLDCSQFFVAFFF